MSNYNLISRVEGPSRRRFLHMAAGTAVLPAAVGTGAGQEEGSIRGRKVIDDFERGDLSPYKYDGRDAWNFDIHSGDYVYSGDHSLEVQTSYERASSRKLGAFINELYDETSDDERKDGSGQSNVEVSSRDVASLLVIAEETIDTITDAIRAETA